MIVQTKFEFPFKLHAMLNDAEQQQNTVLAAIVSWLPNGNGFHIRDSKNFANVVLPHYFDNKIQYRSFQRQLNIYGFERITDKKSPQFGAYCHPLLKRGCPELCLEMSRQKVKKQSPKQHHVERKHSKPPGEDERAMLRHCDNAFVNPQQIARDCFRNDSAITELLPDMNPYYTRQQLTETIFWRSQNEEAFFDREQGHLEPIPINPSLKKGELSVDFGASNTRSPENVLCNDETLFEAVWQ